MKAIFIDRDGVINKDPGGWTEHNYVTRWRDFKFLPGAIDALKLLNRSRIMVIVISNQAGVSKGYFTQADLDNVTSRMLEEIGKSGGKIEAVYYCTHQDSDKCKCRKPKTGLFKKAARNYNIDLKDTFFVGDSFVDVEAGNSLGMKTVFVLSGKFSENDVKTWKEKPRYVFKDLLEAVKWMLEREKRKFYRAKRRE